MLLYFLLSLTIDTNLLFDKLILYCIVVKLFTILNKEIKFHIISSFTRKNKQNKLYYFNPIFIKVCSKLQIGLNSTSLAFYSEFLTDKKDIFNPTGLIYEAHLAPVYSVQRNPFCVKNFLTVGDWTIKLWAEDFNQSPIMWTRPSKAQVNFTYLVSIYEFFRMIVKITLYFDLNFRLKKIMKLFFNVS